MPVSGASNAFSSLNVLRSSAADGRLPSSNGAAARRYSALAFSESVAISSGVCSVPATGSSRTGCCKTMSHPSLSAVHGHSPCHLLLCPSLAPQIRRLHRRAGRRHAERLVGLLSLLPRLTLERRLHAATKLRGETRIDLFENLECHTGIDLRSRFLILRRLFIGVHRVCHLPSGKHVLIRD